MIVERGDSLVKAVDMMGQLGELLQLIQVWRFMGIDEAIDARIEGGHRRFGLHVRDVFGNGGQLVEGVVVVLFDLKTKIENNPNCISSLNYEVHAFTLSPNWKYSTVRSMFLLAART